MAFASAFAFSTTPLRLIGIAGGITLLSSASFTVFAVYARLVLGQSPRGFTALTVLLTLIGGMLLLSLWIIGEYVGRIYEEVKRRPVYLVQREIARNDGAAG